MKEGKTKSNVKKNNGETRKAPAPPSPVAKKELIQKKAMNESMGKWCEETNRKTHGTQPATYWDNLHAYAEHLHQRVKELEEVMDYASKVSMAISNGDIETLHTYQMKLKELLTKYKE